MNNFKKLEFESGYVINNKFRIIEVIGEGWEGKVYRVKERGTGIVRAMKVFYPKRNFKDHAIKFYAKKLHRLKSCNVLIKYLMYDYLELESFKLSFLISEYVEGETLSTYLARQRGNKLSFFKAIHLLHSLSKGVEEIHCLKEYHGDLHSSNVIIESVGLSYSVKLLDFYHLGKPSREIIQSDVVDLIKLFYSAIGGARVYKKSPKLVKDLVCGLREKKIKNKFKDAGSLRVYLENINWDLN